MRDSVTCTGCGFLFKPYKKDTVYCTRVCWLRSGMNTPEHQSRAAYMLGKSNIGRGAQTGYIKRDGKHVHRQIGEEALGRPLKSSEVVHHIDCNKQNNARSNLIICTQAYHAALHARMRVQPGSWSKA